ncbi:WD repeat domain phosphoinositide-interacting protein 2-like [Clavelina lepadiformis]|uniref:WD repeat domain phosphoinositide-interacting protein 2 n=1 Tax=Clavelina lepadiformis TaxID=159417 RepID=A0ABP0FEV9_CLALP
MNFNLASHGTSNSRNGILFANFNQDCTSLAVGSASGFQLYALTSVDNLELIFDNQGETTEVCLVDRLFSSSLVALVSITSPRKLKVCHFKKGTEICNYSYSNSILSVKLNRIRLVVVLEESLYIHNIRDMKVLHTIRDTPKNTKGLCCLSISNENSYLAYPGSSIVGEVQVFDVTTLRTVSTIHAHNSPLAAMAFNHTAKKIATASSKGTVIRVFSVPDGQKLFEFRRGVKRCVSIGSLGFSPDSMFLCASSNTETVHIFKLEQSNTEKQVGSEETGTWMGYFNKVLSNSANYLPVQVSEVLNQGRDFATVKLPFTRMRNVCAIAVLQKVPRILVADEDGYLYIYNLDPADGGECTLLRQHSLLRNTYPDPTTPEEVPTTSHQDGDSPLFHSSSVDEDVDKMESLAIEANILSLDDKTNS